MKFTLSPHVVHCLLQHKIRLSVIGLTCLPSLVPASDPVLQPRESPPSYLKKSGCFLPLSFCSRRFLGLARTSPRHLWGTPWTLLARLSSSAISSGRRFPTSACPRQSWPGGPPFPSLHTSVAASTTLHATQMTHPSPPTRPISSCKQGPCLDHVLPQSLRQCLPDDTFKRYLMEQGVEEQKTGEEKEESVMMAWRAKTVSGHQYRPRPSVLPITFSLARPYSISWLQLPPLRRAPA